MKVVYNLVHVENTYNIYRICQTLPGNKGNEQTIISKGKISKNKNPKIIPVLFATPALQKRIMLRALCNLQRLYMF